MTEGRSDEPGDAPDDAVERPGPRPGVYEPPWRDARARVPGAWARAGPGRRVALALAALLAAGLLGAFVFGLWHVLVGGLLKGNWNAGGFGIALASVAGVLLWIEAAIAGRVLPPQDRGPR